MPLLTAASAFGLERRCKSSLRGVTCTASVPWKQTREFNLHCNKAYYQRQHSKVLHYSVTYKTQVSNMFSDVLNWNLTVMNNVNNRWWQCSKTCKTLTTSEQNETVTLIKSFVVVGRGIFGVVSQLPLNFTKTLTHNITDNAPMSYEWSCWWLVKYNIQLPLFYSHYAGEPALSGTPS